MSERQITIKIGNIEKKFTVFNEQNEYILRRAENIANKTLNRYNNDFLSSIMALSGNLVEYGSYIQKAIKELSEINNDLDEILTDSE